MKQFIIFAFAAFLFASCGNEKAQQDETQQQPGMPSAKTPPPAKQDISTATLVGLDADIQKYQDAVDKAQAAHASKPSDKSKANLFDAYFQFAYYMTYDSPVTPRQGKYRRALVEFRHALALDPSSEKVKSEIAQIENIYREMGRPIPQDDL